MENKYINGEEDLARGSEKEFATHNFSNTQAILKCFSNLLLIIFLKFAIHFSQRISIKGAVMQIEKVLINDRLRVSKIS